MRIKRKYRIFVRTATGHIQPYSDSADPWCTSVQVTRDGDLKIWEGFRVRVFHPAGEWAAYTMEPIA